MCNFPEVVISQPLCQVCSISLISALQLGFLVVGSTDSLLQETPTGFLCEAISIHGSAWWLDQEGSRDQLGIFIAQIENEVVAIFG